MHLGKCGGSEGKKRTGNKGVDKITSVVSCELPYVCWHLFPAFKRTDSLETKFSSTDLNGKSKLRPWQLLNKNIINYFFN